MNLPVLPTCGDCAHGKLDRSMAFTSTKTLVRGHCKHEKKTAYAINLVAAPPAECPLRREISLESLYR
jgi:hypothetical protein